MSLVYTANGVKVEDKMGQLGFGWTLACGGVITRVVRGGIADGESKGFLNNTLTQTAEAVSYTHLYRVILRLSGVLLFSIN